MTAFTSHQHLPQLIDEMSPGDAKDLVFQLCGGTNRSVYMQYLQKVKMLFKAVVALNFSF